LERTKSELVLVMSLVPLTAGPQIDLRFVGVSDLTFRGERTELTGIVLLIADDISARGWDGSKFRVKDYEEEFISFVCREIERPKGEVAGAQILHE